MTGFELSRLKPYNDDAAEAVRTPLYQLKFTGRADQPSRRLAAGVKNECPFCGHGPLICPTCGYRMIDCTKCGQMTAILATFHEGAKDKRLRGQPQPKGGPIIEGKTWDGSDFVGDNFISKRAVDWLLSVHAAPFAVAPARIRIDGMTDAQLAKLEAATKLGTLAPER